MIVSYAQVAHRKIPYLMQRYFAVRLTQAKENNRMAVKNNISCSPVKQKQNNLNRLETEIKI